MAARTSYIVAGLRNHQNEENIRGQVRDKGSKEGTGKTVRMDHSMGIISENPLPLTFHANQCGTNRLWFSCIVDYMIVLKDFQVCRNMHRLMMEGGG